ncbi:MAG: cobalamin biosynthesis protein CobQ [Oscillospiraceae bacterium]|nr:cobalamin biosynthesis protein CobQ [Oscillospiraceae bacterium]
MDRFNYLKRVVAITGHYGCGKTNFALNLALHTKNTEQEVVLIDLDIVNPYFITSDFSEMLTAEGVSVINSQYANSLIETPSVSREISAVIRSDRQVIIDVGGDDVGAVALGRFWQDFEAVNGLDVIYLFSIYRPQTGSIEDVRRHVEAIEISSRQKVTGLVNSSNLAGYTTLADIERSEEFSTRLSEYLELPLIATLSIQEISRDNYWHISRFVKLPWE